VVAGYKPGVDVLRGISAHVDAGEAVAIVGANGAGKSSFLRAASGLLPLRAGSISFAGREVASTPSHRLARAGLAHVPEGREVFLHQTVRENLRLGAMGSGECDARMERLLDIFPALREKLGQRAGELSGGQQQMLAIARGLMSEPALLMIDEPSLGLSPKLVDEVAAMLERVRRELGTALLLVEQNTTIAMAVADRALVVRRGEIVLEAQAESLLGNAEVSRAYLA
jgi:branched-chain amino acid transport system ATP-binding protein